MPHIFSGDPEVLRSERRKKILPVDVFERDVLSRLNYRNNAVDYGAGTGYFTEVMARHFRRVYAIETQDSMISILKEEMEEKGIKNVGIVISDKPPDLDFDIDFVLFSNVLHEVDDFTRFIEWSRISRVACIIEWKKIQTDFGPPIEERISYEEMERIVKEKFRFVMPLDIFPLHYTLLCYNESDALKKPDDESENRP